MPTILKRLMIAFFILATLSTTTLAQNSQAPVKDNQSAESNVAFSSLKTRIFTIKYRDPRAIHNVILLLSSGSRGASIMYNDEFKTITVRDYPENLATIEEAIKRLDTPEVNRTDIEFRIHILTASNNTPSSGEFPEELKDVIKQLQSTLSYKNYNLIASVYQRGKEGESKVSNSGVVDPKQISFAAPMGNSVFYNYSLGPISLDTSSGSSAPVIQIRQFAFNIKVPLDTGQLIQYSEIGFNTPVSLRSGEKVVVGTTTIMDKGLIVVISANVAK